MNEQENQIKLLDTIASLVKANRKGKGKPRKRNVIDNLINEEIHGLGIFDSIKKNWSESCQNVSNFIHNNVSQVTDNFIYKYALLHKMLR